MLRCVLLRLSKPIQMEVWPSCVAHSAWLPPAGFLQRTRGSCWRLWKVASEKEVGVGCLFVCRGPVVCCRRHRLGWTADGQYMSALPGLVGRRLTKTTTAPRTGERARDKSGRTDMKTTHASVLDQGGAVATTELHACGFGCGVLAVLKHTTRTRGILSRIPCALSLISASAA